MSDFIKITKGKTYSMTGGGAMQKKAAIKKMNTPPANTPKKTLIKKGAYGGKVKKVQSYGKGKSGGGCGCGGGMTKHQQGGVIANTGSDIEGNQFNAVQSKVFPGGVPAAMGAAGFNSPATSNQSTIPGSSKDNEKTVMPKGAIVGQAAGSVSEFLKKLKMRRQSAGMNTGAPMKPMLDKGLNQFSGGTAGNNGVRMDSTGNRVFEKGGVISEDLNKLNRD